MSSRVLGCVFPRCKILSLFSYLHKYLLDRSDREFVAFCRAIVIVFPPNFGVSAPPTTNQPDSDWENFFLRTCRFIEAGNVLHSTVVGKGPRDLFWSSGFWQVIFKLVGEARLFEILTQTSIFRRLAASDDCWIQVAGPPVSSKHSRRLGMATLDESIQLSSIMFSRPITTASNKILNCLMRKMPRNAMHLFHLVFGQNLPSAKSLHLLRPHFERAVREMHRIPTGAILETFCKGVNEEGFLQMAEQESGYFTQSTESLASKIDPSAISVSQVASNVGQVFSFLLTIVARIFPPAFWGSSNWHCVKSCMRKLLLLRRYEALSLQPALQRLSPLQFAPIRDLPISNKEAFLHWRKILGKIFSWLLSKFVVSAIRCNFYVTESTVSRSVALFIRHSLWNLLAEAFQRSKAFTSTFDPLVSRSSATLDAYLNAYHGTQPPVLRFLPKQKGLRSIVNLSRSRSHSGAPAPSQNQQLANSRLVFSIIRDRFPRVFGNAVYGVSQIYDRLLTFKQRLQRLGHSFSKETPLYFAKVDIKTCYDSILHDRLSHALQSAFRLLDSEFILQRYFTVGCSGRTMFFKATIPVMEPFSQYVAKAALQKRRYSLIFVPQDSGVRISKKAVEVEIERLFRLNLVSTRSCSSELRHFVQRVGIPQGSVLSNDLCALYYGEMDHSNGLVNTDPESLFMRFVDDYLAISRNPLVIRQFLETFSCPISQYNCAANLSKTVANVDDTAKHPIIEWCGIFISPVDLSVSFSSAPVTFTVAQSSFAGSWLDAFLRKIRFLLCTRLTEIFLDERLNGKTVVRQNLERAFECASLNVRRYLYRSNRSSLRESLLKQAIRRLFTAASRMIRRLQRRNGNVAREFTQTPKVAAAFWSAFAPLCPRQDASRPSKINSRGNCQNAASLSAAHQFLQ